VISGPGWGAWGRLAPADKIPDAKNQKLGLQESLNKISNIGTPTSLPEDFKYRFTETRSYGTPSPNFSNIHSRSSCSGLPFVYPFVCASATESNPKPTRSRPAPAPDPTGTAPLPAAHPHRTPCTRSVQVQITYRKSAPFSTRVSNMEGVCWRAGSTKTVSPVELMGLLASHKKA